jgi:hypothetical protein
MKTRRQMIGGMGALIGPAAGPVLSPVNTADLLSRFEKLNLRASFGVISTA